MIKKRHKVRSKNYPRLGRPLEGQYNDFVELDEKPYNLRFSYDEEKLYRELSDRLYPDHFCSIRELAIQNPFDIDASEVKITLDLKNGRIIFQDNGSGMDRKTIFNNFLIIGASAKTESAKTKRFDRPTIGSKGIGRLSWQKLGRYAKIVTETDAEAHTVEMHQYDLNVKVQRCRKSGKVGTRWVITGLIPELSEKEVYDYIQQKASILLGLHHNFNISINGKPVRSQKPEGDRIKLSGRDFNAILNFNDDSEKLTITCNHLVVDEIYLYGLGGFVNSSKFNVTTNRDSVVQDDAYHNVLTSLRKAILNEFFRISVIKPKIIKKYREVFINFSASSQNGGSFERLKLAKEIPVRVYGHDWVKLGELKDETLYVEVSADGSPSPKAERATELNIPVILASSGAEKLLIKALTNAEDISRLPSDLLDGRGKTIKARGKLKTLLQSSADVLKLMTDVNIAIMPEDEFNPGERNMLPKVEPIMVNFQESRNAASKVRTEFIEEKRKNARAPSDRPRYIITRSDSDCVSINGIKLALCQMDRRDINALANPATKEIFININSVVIQKIFAQNYHVQRALLMEEISHELAHLLGYGLVVHDTPFFKVQRLLKYIAMQAM